MYVVVVGAGAAGFYLASRLPREEKNVEVVVVEQDAEAVEEARRQLDVAVVHGDGALPSVLREAEVQRADFVVSLTAVDAANMITCFMAKELGAKKTVARVRNPEYSGYGLVGRKSPYATRKIVRPRSLGVDFFVNPEREAAREIISILSSLYVTPMGEFGDGRVQWREFRAASPAVVGKNLSEIPFPRPCVVMMVSTSSGVTVPGPKTTIGHGDRMYVIAARRDMDELGALFEVPLRSTRTVVVFGAGAIGLHVAEVLEKRGVHVKVIEKNAAHAVEIGSKLKRAEVVQGGRPDRELLIEEGVGKTDAFVAATGDESLNILAGLLARDVGTSRSIVLVDKPEYITLAEAVGVNVALSPLLMAGSRIAQHILHSGAVSVASLGEEDAQAVEFMIPPASTLVGRTVSNIEWPGTSRVGAIVRGDTVIVPPDAATIEPGDRIIVASILESMPRVERLFR
ncbi:MAG: Trk system potassium transporter TrkA [Chloroflexota bacterium]